MARPFSRSAVLSHRRSRRHYKARCGADEWWDGWNTPPDVLAYEAEQREGEEKGFEKLADAANKKGAD